MYLTKNLYIESIKISILNSKKNQEANLNMNKKFERSFQKR